MGLLIGYSFLIGKPIEFAIMFLSYFVTKGLYKRQYHANSLKQCMLLSVGIFALAVTMTLPKNYSICFSLVFGLVIALVSYKVGNAQCIAHEYTVLTTPKPFSVDTCTETELLARCKELRLSQENIELAVEFFIHKTKQSVLADRLCIDETSIARRKLRLKQKLNKEK